MKITRVECLIAGKQSGASNAIFIRTHTDEGLHGIGEAYPVGPDLATAGWVNYFADQLIGHDPTRIEFLWALMYQGARFPLGSSGMAALSGIDHSLWDITGKAIGLPVYELLGGRFRDRIRVYHGAHAESAGSLAEAGARFVTEQGFTALKTNPLPRNHREMLWGDAISAGRRQLAALREAVGPDVDIGLDAHAAVFEPARILELCDALAEYRPWFMEEPLRMENRHAMAVLRRKMPFALATGECLYTKYELGDLIREKAVDILQPDICICGGMTEMRKIAANAEAHDLVVAPHNPMGPVATMVNVHFAAATPNFMVLEYRTPEPLETQMVKGIPVPENGYIEIPTAPGWGVDLVDEIIEAHPHQQPWRRGDRRLADGSVAYI